MDSTRNVGSVRQKGIFPDPAGANLANKTVASPLVQRVVPQPLDVARQGQKADEGRRRKRQTVRVGLAFNAQRRTSNSKTNGHPTRAQNQQRDNFVHSQLRRHSSGAIGADQSGRANSRAGAGGDEPDLVQHAAGGRDRFRDADFSGNESVERRHLASSTFVQLGDNDRAVEIELVIEPANVATVLRNELRARAR